MQVSELMHEGVIIAQVNDSIRTVAKLMKENDIGAVPIYDDEKPAGFVTDRDIVLAIADEELTPDESIAAAMSPEFIAISQDSEVTEAARLMEEHQISRLLVVSEERPVGIITLQDLSMNLENSHLKAEVLEEIKH